MDRLLSRVLAFGILSAAMLFGSPACSGGPEQTIIGQFFNASRLRDGTSLDNFSTVVFDPRTQGTVTSFTLLDLSPEQHKPLGLRTLARAHEEAKAEDEAFSRRKDEFQSSNLEAIQRVLKAERENARLNGKDAEVQTVWTKLRDESVSVSKKVSEVRRNLRTETQLVDLSINSGGRTATDVTKHDGEMVVKEATVSAPVRLPDGTTANRTFVFTLQRAILKGDKDGKDIVGRWIITGYKDVAASPATKTS